MKKKRIKELEKRNTQLVNNEISYGYLWENDEIPRLNKYCKECKLKQELTPASEVISLDDNIFDIKARPTIGVKRFSNLVESI